ncbi:MAG: PKD domain-containing protein [Verrucomicrobiia bacterium]
MCFDPKIAIQHFYITTLNDFLIMFRHYFAIFALALPVLALADTIPGQALVDFEAGSDGNVVTAALLGSGTKGKTWNGWQTLSNPGSQTVGATPNLIISSGASYQLYTPANISGTVYPGTGTRGLRETMAADNAAQITFPAPGYMLSVGFYFRFNGPQINYSPRDVFGMRSDPSGNYQFLQIYDGPQPYFHTHWQPYGGSDNGIGNNINFNRNQWYWVTMCHVGGGGTFKISFYDPSNNYSLVGTSTAAVSSGTLGCTTIQAGCVKYSSGGTQSVDFDNIIINTNGVFPLGPGSGSISSNNLPPVVVASATPTSGAAPLTVVFSSVGSHDPEGAALSYNWSFGDGTTSTSANPSHIYDSEQTTYSAQLSVSDGTNVVSSSILTITPLLTAPSGLRVISTN